MLDESAQLTTPSPFDENLLAKERPVAATLYDAEAENYLPYTIEQDGFSYEIAHVFAPVGDERYMQWQRDMKVRGNGDKLEEEAREANVKLWNEIIIRLDGVEYDAASDWKSLVEDSEKNEAINHLFTVAPFREGKKAEGKPQLTRRESQTIFTEAYFAGEILKQTHTMRVKTLELEKRYERILAKQTRLEQTKGLRRKPFAEFVPQDDKIGELYDSMNISTAGFKPPMGTVSGTSAGVPLRFKVAVIKFIFAPTLDPKLVGK